MSRRYQLIQIHMHVYIYMYENTQHKIECGYICMYKCLFVCLFFLQKAPKSKFPVYLVFIVI